MTSTPPAPVRRYCVYRHTTPNGKVYIGITSTNPLKRWRNGAGYIRNVLFYNAVLKYGWDNITHEILFSGLSEAEATRAEVDLIAKHRACDPAFGYNLRPGGDTTHHTPESKKKMSDARRKWQISDETRAKMSRQRTGRKQSEDTRKKIAASAKGRSTWSKGKHFTEEHKQHLHASNLYKQEGKRVIQKTDEGDVIAVYQSIRDAERITRINRRSISFCLEGVNAHAGGFVWEEVKK